RAASPWRRPWVSRVSFALEGPSQLESVLMSITAAPFTPCVMWLPMRATCTKQSVPPTFPKTRSSPIRPPVPAQSPQPTLHNRDRYETREYRRSEHPKCLLPSSRRQKKYNDAGYCRHDHQRKYRDTKRGAAWPSTTAHDVGDRHLLVGRNLTDESAEQLGDGRTRSRCGHQLNTARCYDDSSVNLAILYAGFCLGSVLINVDRIRVLLLSEGFFEWRDRRWRAGHTERDVMGFGFGRRPRK